MTYITTPGDVLIDRSAFDTGGSIADWYNVDCVDEDPVDVNTCLVFRVADPGLDVAIFDSRIGLDVSSKSVMRGEPLRFGIANSLYPALTTNRTPVYNTSTGDGFIDIKVMNESGTVFNQLYTKQFASPANKTTLWSINVTTSPYYWGLAPLDAAAGASAGVPPFSWQTDASMNGHYVYALGTYEVWAESRLNDMKEKYLDDGGAYYTGKTVSQIKTITIIPETVSAVAGENSVARTRPFSVTITGRPATWYNVWIMNTSGMNPDTSGNAPPIIAKSQLGVNDGNFTTYNYLYQNGGGTNTVGMNAYGQSNVEDPAFSYSYAYVKTTISGYATIEFITTNKTKEQIYTVRVERNINGNDYNNGNFKGAEVTVIVGQSKFGVFRNGYWYVDWNGNGAWDSTDAQHVGYFGANPGDIPIIGDWDGTGPSKFGVFRNGYWYVDWNGNGAWDTVDAQHVGYFGANPVISRLSVTGMGPEQVSSACSGMDTGM